MDSVVACYNGREGRAGEYGRCAAIYKQLKYWRHPKSGEGTICSLRINTRNFKLIESIFLGPF